MVMKFGLGMLYRLAGLILIASAAQAAPVIWNGPMTNFIQEGFDPTQPTNQDRITQNVWITRAQTQGIFNAAQEQFFTANFSPEDTEWADGSTSNYATLSYTNWNVWVKVEHSGPPSTIGVPAVVHLISEDIYIDIKFTFWGASGGGFGYQRSTPSPSVNPPSVSITNPADGAVFAAPANVSVSAAASMTGGSVTNVEFFLNNTSIGSVQAAPFTIQVDNLSAASYQLAAAATGAGLSTTSSVIHFSVVTPIVISNSPPQVTNGQFAFDYSANTGLRYVVQRSANLLDWTSVVTNTATNNPAHFTDDLVPDGSFFYRVGRLPNP